jgi:ABC-type branched-subunit amino acid transport system substrate-binding protein
MNRLQTFELRKLCIVALLLSLTGCGWFGGNVADDAHPGYGNGPLAAPDASPAIPVQKTVIPFGQTEQAVPPAVAPTPPPVAMAAMQPAPTPAPAPVIVTGGPGKVALLLPLSGPNAAIGQAMLNAAQMAVFDAGLSDFALMPRDTARAGGAATAARDAIASGAQLLIGPLFAVDVTPAHDAALPSGVSLLTLSTDTALAQHGVYVMGFAPMPQVDRVIAYASSRGARRFAALLPNNAYGTLVGEEFRDAVGRHGGAVIAVENYDPATHDSSTHIHTLATIKNDIDALFLPEGGGDLGLIAGQLAASGFDNHAVHLLGTGLWDTPDLARAQNFLIGGWYAAPDPALRVSFINSYAKTYGREPPRLATLAYDATALAAALAKRGTGYGDTALTNPNGFAGLDGIFRLLPNGIVERGLAVNEVTPKGAEIIDKAPNSFVESN